MIANLAGQADGGVLKHGAVIYARYSSEHQREASLDDQIRLCTDFVERQGWTCGRSYSDQAISGASLLRPGYQKLLEIARAGVAMCSWLRAGPPVARPGIIANLFKHLAFAGIQIATVAEEVISELHVGLKGTMNAIYLTDLAIKTRRGLEGRVREGKSGGGGKRLAKRRPKRSISTASYIASSRPRSHARALRSLEQSAGRWTPAPLRPMARKLSSVESNRSGLISGTTI